MPASATPCSFPSAPRIAVVGSGAMGCYYGGRLAQHGADVHFLMRSDLEHVRRSGLTVRSCLGDFSLPRVQCAGSAEEIGPCDLVLICLKTTSNRELLRILPPLLGPDTVLLTIQNGLGNEAFLAEHWGAHRVIGGVAFTCINRIAPGVIDHSAQGEISIGEYTGTEQARTRQIAELCSRSGIACTVVDSVMWVRWRKLVWNIPFNGLTILGGGITTEDVLNDPSLALLAESLMEEVIRIATGLGHIMPDGLVQDQILRTRTMAAYRPSSMIDYVEGREVEVESIWGEPWRQAVAAGLPAARLEMIYHLIRSAVARR